MKYITFFLLFFCLSANAQPKAKVGEVATSPTLKPKKQPKYDALALAQTVLEGYIKNADTIRTSDRKRKINTYIFFYIKENVNIEDKKIKNCLIWNKNKESFIKKDAFPLIINNTDSIKYRFIEIKVGEEDAAKVGEVATSPTLKPKRIVLYFDTNNYFRGSKTDKMQLVETAPDCTPRTIRKNKNETVLLAPINCLNTDAYFEYNKKTKKWLMDSNFDRNVERRTWFLKRFLF